MKADFTIFFSLVFAVAAFVAWIGPTSPRSGLVLVQLYRETSGWERRRGGASGGMDQYKIFNVLQ
jgi:hypothetical protein